jgi:hypothetical protein
MDFLNQTEGKRTVSDFYAKLKRCDGSRFVESFSDAVFDLAYKSGSYMLSDAYTVMDPPLRNAYQLLEGNAMNSLMQENLSRENAIDIIAICIFWVLHEQNAEV